MGQAGSQTLANITNVSSYSCEIHRGRRSGNASQMLQCQLYSSKVRMDYLILAPERVGCVYWNMEGLGCTDTMSQKV